MSLADEPCKLLFAYLRRLDVLLHRQILRMRAAYRLSLDEFRGLYVSDELVDSYLNAGLRDAGTPVAEGQPEPVTIESLTSLAANMRSEIRRQEADLRFSPLAHLQSSFKLSTVEMDLVLLAAAPDIDIKYETLYAYLNNDVSRKWPTFDLALRMFDDEYPTVRKALMPEGILFTSGLLREMDRRPDRLSWLASPFCARHQISHYLLELPQPGSSMGGADAPYTSQIEAERVAVLLENAGSDSPLLIVQGAPGTGRRQFAHAVCEALARPARWLDLREASEGGGSVDEALQDGYILQRLYRNVLCVTGIESLFEADGSVTPAGLRFSEVLQESGQQFRFALICGPNTRWRAITANRRALRVERRLPDVSERIALWRSHIDGGNGAAADEEIETLAGQFVMSAHEISETAASAALACRVSSTDAPLTAPAYFKAARDRSGQALTGLATKVTSAYGWDDLVLPPPVLAWVRQVARALQNRRQVMDIWGMGARMAGGGLTALFSGASGTGKTMTAGVIANDIGQDMYKVDLAGVVSKYIGETEKNLDRIFTAARQSNVLLFFDEADALLGKRSEVKDAHDRYANIEVAYLLQKLEEYDGAVILATNLSKNMDVAFARRMNFVVDFPIPGEAERERLWRGMFPPEAPIGDDVDFGFLAAQFTLPGGDIRNAALTAAFLAGDCERIEMKHLARALARQLIKQGRIPLPTDFKQYYRHIGEQS